MLFFFYGTLVSPRFLQRVLGRDVGRSAGVGHVRGSLYDLGDYPGLVLRGDSSVPGVLVEVPEEAVGRLDEYEGVGEGLYARREVAVGRSDGGSRPAWTYVYLGPVDGRPKIRRWPADRAESATGRRNG